MLKIKRLIVLIIPILLLCGCSNNEETDDTTIYVYTDKDTCVEYLKFNGYYKGNLTPRLNQDGTLKINKDCMKIED